MALTVTFILKIAFSDFIDMFQIRVINDAETCFFLLFDAAASLKNLLIIQSMNEKC